MTTARKVENELFEPVSQEVMTRLAPSRIWGDSTKGLWSNARSGKSCGNRGDRRRPKGESELRCSLGRWSIRRPGAASHSIKAPGTKSASSERFGGRFFVLGLADQLTGLLEILFVIAVGQEPVRADAHEPLGSYVHQQAPQELLSVESVESAVAAAEGDLTIFIRLDPVVGDGHPRQIREYPLWPLERRLGVDLPSTLAHSPEEPFDRDAVRQPSEMALFGGCSNGFTHERAEAIGQRFDRQIVRLERNPPLAVLGKPAAGPHAMSMEIESHTLSPRLQVRLTAELDVQLAPAHVDHGLTGCANHDVVQLSRTIPGQLVERCRHGEHDLQVRNR